MARLFEQVPAEDDLELYSNAMRDPAIRSRIEGAKQDYARLLSENGLDGVDGIVQYLNMHCWGNLLDKPVVVTSHATVIEQVGQQYVSSGKYFLDSENLLFRGFGVQDSEASIPDLCIMGYKVIAQDKVLYKFPLEADLQFTGNYSDVHSAAFLRVNLPGLVDQIDRLYKRSVSGGEILLSIKDLDLSELYALDRYSASKACYILSTVLAEDLAIDRHSPYVIDFRGDAVLENHPSLYRADDYLFAADRLRVVDLDAGGDARYVIGASGTIMDKKGAAYDRSVFLGGAGIASAKSIRDIYYGRDI